MRTPAKVQRWLIVLRSQGARSKVRSWPTVAYRGLLRFGSEANIATSLRQPSVSAAPTAFHLCRIRSRPMAEFPCTCPPRRGHPRKAQTQPPLAKNAVHIPLSGSWAFTANVRPAFPFRTSFTRTRALTYPPPKTALFSTCRVSSTTPTRTALASRNFCTSDFCRQEQAWAADPASRSATKNRKRRCLANEEGVFIEGLVRMLPWLCRQVPGATRCRATAAQFVLIFWRSLPLPRRSPLPQRTSFGPTQ